MPLLTIFSATLLVLAIMATLIAIDPTVALVAGAGFGSYVTLWSHGYLDNN